MTADPQMSTFLVVANRDDAEPGSGMWDDLLPCLTALHAFGGDRSTLLAWAGADEPCGLPGSVRTFELPRHLSDWEARVLAARELSDDTVLLVGDRVVIGPDSTDELLTDITVVEEAVGEWGVIAARCDSSAGPQLGPVEPGPDAPRVAPVDRIEVTLAAMRREHLIAVDAPLCDVAGDSMVVVELARAGFQSFVGGSYVHRPPTGRPALWAVDGSLHPEIFQRFMHFRHDLLDPFVEAGTAPAPPRELELVDPVRAYHAWLAAPAGEARQLGLARSLRLLDRPREAASMLWELDLAALPETDLRDVAVLLRLNGQLYLERQILDLRPDAFAAEIADLDDLLERTPTDWLPAQWLADVDA